MQILEPQSFVEGHFIEAFGIGTKTNEAKWQISKKTGHDKVQSFINKNFIIVPELIQAPLSVGGGGHYFGKDTLEDLYDGYTKHSHGKISRLKGPYDYNDGTDDYYYNFIIKLRDSKAASALLEEGQKTWVPFSISPHIWPKAGPDSNIEDWEGIGAALVIKGAYGSQAIISKMCNGTSAACEKSLGAGTKCEDTEAAEIISSLVSKSANSPIIMSENKAVSEVTNAPIKTETPKIETQSVVTTGLPQIQQQKVVTPEQYAEMETRLKEVEKQNKHLIDESKLSTLNNMFAKIKDEKVKKELLEEFSKLEKRDVDLINEKVNRLYPILKASEEPIEEEDEKKKEATKKSKGASLAKEPDAKLPRDETDSKAASVTINKTKEIRDFIMSNGGL